MDEHSLKLGFSGRPVYHEQYKQLVKNPLNDSKGEHITIPRLVNHIFYVVATTC